MAEDYYSVLGVPRTASPAEIQKAYRDLARKHHPDLNPDDKTAKKKFQRVQAAFDVLNDPAKRKKYDVYGSSFESAGAGDPRGAYTWTWPPGAGGAGPGPGPGGFNPEDVDLSQILGEQFGQGGGGFGDMFGQFRRAAGKSRRPAAGASGPARGADLVQEVQIPLSTAVAGGEVQLTVDRPRGKKETLAVKIPPGIEDGKKIRIRGHGQAAPRGGTPGDILLTVRVLPHPYFYRRGNHLYVRVPVTIGEAAAGAKVDVPTPRGTVAVSIPPGSSSGTKLRVKGQGVKPKNGSAGDLLAEIQIVLPKGLNEADRQEIRQIDEHYAQNPRGDLRW